MTRHLALTLLVSTTLLTSAVSEALPHDNWISRGAFRSPVSNEWCCGDYDCPALNYTPKVTSTGYLLDNGEVVPFSEAMPSPDGSYVRCHRPDGTRRCFFAPPPNS